MKRDQPNDGTGSAWKRRRARKLANKSVQGEQLRRYRAKCKRIALAARKRSKDIVLDMFEAMGVSIKVVKGEK